MTKMFKMTFLWCFLLLFTFASISLGETVEVTTAGESVTCDCRSECAVLLKKSSEECQQAVLSVQNEKAAVDKTNTDLLNERGELETSYGKLIAEKNDLNKINVDLLAKNDALAEDHRDLQSKILNLEKINGDILAKAHDVEGEARNLNQQLQQANQRAENLNQQLHQATQRAETAETHLENIRQDLALLTAQKEKDADEMANFVKELQGELDTHKSELAQTRESLTKDLENHRIKLRETADSHAQSLKDLSIAHTRMRELHDQVTTTHVNFTLIQQDIATGAHKTAVLCMENLVGVQDAIAPYWVNIYSKSIEPEVENVKAAYKQHLKPSLDKYVFPVVTPVVLQFSDYFSMGKAIVIIAFRQITLVLLNYLELRETGITPFFQRIIAILRYTEQNAKDVFENAAKILVGLILLRMVWPKRKRTVEPKVKVGHRVKGKRIRSGKTSLTPTQ